MDNDPNALASLRARVDRLEAERVRSRIVALIGAVLVSVAFFLGQAFSTGKIVEAEGFWLRDPSGTLRAVLDLGRENTPGLVLFDSRGKARLSLTAQDVGSTIMMVDQKGDRQAEMGAREQGPGFILYGASNTIQTELSLLPEGNRLRFYDGSGRIRAFVGLVRGGQPFLAMGNEGLKPQVELGASGEGTRLWLYDTAGRRRFSADAGNKGPSLFMFGADEQARAYMMVSEEAGDVAVRDGKSGPFKGLKESRPAGSGPSH